MPTYKALKANYIELRVNVKGLHKEEAVKFGEFIKNRLNDLFECEAEYMDVTGNSDEGCYPNNVTDITYEIK